MSFLKKGLLQNYITDYVDGDISKPRFKKNSEEKKGFRKITKKTRVWYIDDDIKNKACEITFLSNEIGSVFQFSLPPQGVEITYPQRVFETKTFGGSVFEDYGNDTVSITIQGSTVNSEIRSFTTKGSQKNGTGFEELKAFQRNLEEFGDINKKKSGAKINFVYDGFNFSVLIKEFTIKQSKDNPLAYSYTISMVGVNKEEYKEIVSLENLQYTFKDKLAKIMKDFENFVETIENYLAVLETGLQVFEDFKDICATIRACISRTEKALNNLVNQILAYIDEVSTCINEVTELSDFVISSGIRMSLGTVDKALNSVNALVDSCDGFLKFFEDFSDTYGEMSSDIIEQWEMTSDEIIETCKYMGVSSKEKAEALRAEIQHTTSSCDVAVAPGDKNSDDEIVFVYGVKTYEIGANDTWDSIAVKFYGDASKASLLSTFNNQKLNASGSSDTDTSSGNSSESSMPGAGTTVYIPVLDSSSGFNGANQVYNLPDVVNNYGADIEISSDGDFNFHNGDFEVTENEETLLQSVINRLSTAVGSRIRDLVYGIQTNIGSTDNTISLVISASIEATLLQDPRIKSVDDIEFNGDGDSLYCTVLFTDINDKQNMIGGTF